MRLLYSPGSSPDDRLARALSELHQVETSRSLEDGLALARLGDADAIICDLDLETSQAVAQFRRAAPSAWLLVVLRAGRDEARVGMLREGADAVFCRPYVFREISAQLDAFARRALQERTAAFRKGPEFAIEPADRAARVGGERVRLSRREFALLALLVARAGQVASVEEILHAVWGEEAGARSELVHTYVARLRDKLERGRPWRLLHGARGHGYRFAIEMAPKPDGGSRT